MTITSQQRSIFIGGTILIMLLVGMHILTGIKGYTYFKDQVEPKSKIPLFMLLTITYQQYQARVIMLMAVAGLTFFTNAFALWLISQPHRIKWLQHLTVFHLAVELGIALLLAISVFEMKLTRNFYIDKIYPSQEYANKIWDGDGFNEFWRILIADMVLAFVPQVAFLIYFYLGLSNQNLNKSDLLTNNEESSYGKF